MTYTLGLDIGSNSIGWAILDKQKQRLIDIGVRVFPEGVDRDTKGLEKSKNATRREARGARRTRQRRNARKQQLLETLQKAGLLPQNEPEIMSLFQKNPYLIRKKGLDNKLELYEFGRMLYHLSQRRGFKSNRKSGESKDDGKVKKEAGELQKKIEAANCRTIGEYFAGINPDEQRIRSRYTFRSMYEKEFDLLWAKQSEFYPQILTENLRKKIRDEIIFFQRPIRWDTETIGNCELEPGEKHCPRADWFARRFRILQDVNNLEIQNPGGSENKLNDDQRKILLCELGRKEKMSFEDIRKKLGLIEKQTFNAEYRIGPNGKRVESIKGDEFVAKMRSKNVFGQKIWDAMNEQGKIKLNDAFVELEDDQLAEKLKTQYGLNEEQIKIAIKVSLPQKYMSFSRKAILKLLPFMEQGTITSKAIEKAGYNRNKIINSETVGKLPLPPNMRNPIVQKALFEVRKLINAIIGKYGKPENIVIEMPRDVQGTSRQRKELHWKMLKNEKRNKEAKKKLIDDINNTRPSRDEVIKYKLWEECGKKCPYTGKSISQNALFGQNPEFQIEHILPKNRSLDDSYMNKTLCYVHENIYIKQDQTPYEAYNHNVEKYEQILQRVTGSLMPYPKKKKFWQKELELDEHIKRELNDTRYICRETVNYIKQLGIYVRGTRGKTTAELRHQWGLDGIFDELGTKRDDDHRRHSVDAAIVAVTENEHLRSLAKSKYSVSGVAFKPPWPNFREEIRENVKQINVSHRVRRKVSGQLHEATAYGPTSRKDEKGQSVFVYRKKIEKLTVPMVEKIIDPVVRQIVKNRLEEQIKKNDKAVAGNKIAKEVWAEPLYMKNKKSNKKILIKKVRIENVASNVIEMKDKSGKVYCVVEPGKNHHIEIFEYKDKNSEAKRDSRVITMFDAVQRSQQEEPVVCKDYGDGRKFICSLVINDLVMMKNKIGKMDIYRIQKMDINKMVRFCHHTASTIDKKETYIDKTAHLFEGYKISVDLIGRVYLAND